MDLLNQTAKIKTFTPSVLQQAVFDAIENTDTSLLVDAVAGSGKTTTIVQAAAYLPTGNHIFMAFNKSIVAELGTKLRGLAECITFHAFGMALIRQAFGRIKVDGYKTSTYMDRVFGSDAFAKKFGDKLSLIKLISFAKGNGHCYLNGVTDEDWQDLIDYHMIEFEVNRPAVYFRKLSKVYDLSLQDEDVIDFDDMILYPIIHNMRFPSYDTVIVDESQDLSSLQHIFITKMLETKGRLIAVGDPYQAIYGFRGANSESIQRMKELFSLQTMPLNLSYRCSKAVQREAVQIVPNFECLPDAPEGSVSTIYELPEPEDIHADTMVLCRYNAPLFMLGLNFLKNRIPVRLWTNLDRTIKARIKQFKEKKTKQWLSKLDTWAASERLRYEEKEQWAQLDTFEDIYSTLVALAEGTTDTKQILQRLEQLTDSYRGPILSTIHKAKGHEARDCLIIGYNLMPSKYAKADWMRQQEENLRYVAITRAKENLTFHIMKKRED